MAWAASWDTLSTNTTALLFRTRPQVCRYTALIYIRYEGICTLYKRTEGHGRSVRVTNSLNHTAVLSTETGHYAYELTKNDRDIPSTPKSSQRRHLDESNYRCCQFFFPNETGHNTKKKTRKVCYTDTSGGSRRGHTHTHVKRRRRKTRMGCH